MIEYLVGDTWHELNGGEKKKRWMGGGGGGEYGRSMRT